MKKLSLSFLGVALLLAGCGGGNQSARSGAPTPAASVASSIDFPLYNGSRVLAAKAFTQVINSKGSTYSGVMMAGDGTYHGNEVIAATPASFDELRTWVRSMDTNVPKGYAPVKDASVSDARDTVEQYGLDFALFQQGTGAQRTGLLVLVMDPSRVSKKLGPALGLVSTYRNLPQVMRQPIDDKVKAQTGFTVTELTQPESPIGIALETLNDFSHSNQRAIVLVNARKQ